MKKIHVVIGTRPDAIKMAPVFKALKQKRNLEVKLISTGQHKDLLEQVFKTFNIKPDIDLEVMKSGQSLSQLTMKLLEKLENLYKRERPDLVLAHGDTTTCYGTALSAFYHSLPFYHVEAGLRTNDIKTPFPEEFNRQSVAHLATHHFAPGTEERENLLREGILAKAITVTGGTIKDAVKEMKATGVLVSPDAHEKLVLFTLHRRELLEDLKGILEAIKSAAIQRPDFHFLSPLHPSPAVRKAAREVFSGVRNITLSEPLSYPDFLNILSRSFLIITDSGGVQEEASFFGKNVFIVRQSTERLDGLKEGFTRIIGNNPVLIKKIILNKLNEEIQRNAPQEEVPGLGPSSIIAQVVHERCYA